MSIDAIAIGGLLVSVLGLAAYFYISGRSAGSTAQVASDQTTAQKTTAAELGAATAAPGDVAGTEGQLDDAKF